MDNKKIYDLTQAINESTVVFPGDPTFKSEVISSIDKGTAFNLCCWQLGNHTGTHIDYPAHVVKGGKTSSDYPLEYLQGSGLIIEVPDSEKSITAQFIRENNDIFKNDIVFFKTSNAELRKKKEFSETFVYIEPDAAEELIKKGVKIIGIDYLSVDSYSAKGLPIHNILLQNNILILLNLDLNEIPEERYHITIAPIKVEDTDGAPATVFAIKYTGV